jgi:hypothetical protein
MAGLPREGADLLGARATPENAPACRFTAPACAIIWMTPPTDHPAATSHPDAASVQPFIGAAAHNARTFQTSWKLE